MEYALVLWWLVAFGALAALGYPVAALLFRRFPSRGAGLALPVALVVLTTVVYWVGHVTFGPLALIVGGAVLVTAAVASALDLDALRRRRVVARPSLAPDPSAVAEAAAVFVAAFLFLVAVRAADPAVHAVGGEKFLDFGLLRSLLRADALPPEDMWFAGERVQYYYGGHLVTAVLTKLTATDARFAYNLALAGFYAMLVTGAYDLAGAVAAGEGGSRRFASVVGAFAVGFAANLETGVKVLVWSLMGIVAPLGNAVADELSHHTDVFSMEEFIAGPAGFSYWDASRVVPGTINEFPLFAWLNGDLHAHMMGTPFLLVGAALGYALFREPAENRNRRLALLFVALPVLGGLQIIVDTWSFPSLFGLAWLALAFAPAPPWTLLPESLAVRAERWMTDDPAAREAARLGCALVLAGVAGALAVLLGLPFLLSAGASREVAVLPPNARSPFASLLVVHGGFLLAFGGYLLGRILDDRLWPMALALAALVAVGLTQSMAVLAVAVPLLILGWVALRLRPRIGYETVLVLAGAGLVLLVEVLYVEEQAGPLRMNTVFKTYMQVWVLWSVAIGAVIPRLLDTPRPEATPWPDVAVREYAAPVFVALLLVSTGSYGVLALGDHFGGENPYAPAEPTLDATQFAEDLHPQEYEAIQWLDGRATDDTTLLSAPGTGWYPQTRENGREPGMYNWHANPASSLTGVPTVAGWAHEVGYRGSETYYSRVQEVDRAYTGSPAQTAAVLRKYDVEYVWVGPAEQARYGDVTLERTKGLEVAFENEAVTVYQVHPERLPKGSTNETRTGSVNGAAGGAVLGSPDGGR